MKKKSYKLPTYMTTVTPLSKTVALGMLVILPYLGFYLGIQYHKTTTPKACYVMEP